MAEEYERGQVIKCLFSYQEEGKFKNKERPFLIINPRLPDNEILCVYISTKEKKWPKVSIDKDTPEWVAAGLWAPSFIYPHKLYYIKQRMVLGKLGNMFNILDERVDLELLKVLRIRAALI
jgi:hypothetical protein